MSFYTSYFGRLQRVPIEITPVSIALYSPKWYRGTQYKRLAPTERILREWKFENNVEKYINDFRRDILSKLSAHDVARDLIDFSNGGDVVLLCYEKRGDFCHRHLVADWLKEYGYPCEELLI